MQRKVPKRRRAAKAKNEVFALHRGSMEGALEPEIRVAYDIPAKGNLPVHDPIRQRVGDWEEAFDFRCCG